MSLIMDAIKRAQQLRLKELKGAPFFKGPGPNRERRRIGKKVVWMIAIAGSGILLLFLGSYLFPQFRSQPSQEVASLEKKDFPTEEAVKKDFQEPPKEEAPPPLLEKPFAKETGDELLIKSKPKKKKKKKTTPSVETGMDQTQTAPLAKEEIQPNPTDGDLETRKEAKAETKEIPSTPVSDQPIKKVLPSLPKQEVLAKPLGAESENEKSRARASEILTHFNSGVDFYRQKEFLRAIQAYEKVIEMDPTYIEAYNNLGIIYQEIGHFDKALEAYHKAVELSPQYTKAYNNLGILFYLGNRYEESTGAFQKALAINPNNIESLINLGTVSKRLGQMDKAIEYYQKAITLNPLHGEAHYNIGLLYEQLENVELAVTHYQQFVQSSSKTHPHLVSKVQKRLVDLMKARDDKRK